VLQRCTYRDRITREPRTLHLIRLHGLDRLDLSAGLSESSF